MAKEAKWRVRNFVCTKSGDRLLEDLSPEERDAFAEGLFMAFAQSLAPEGVTVRVREGRAVKAVTRA